MVEMLGPMFKSESWPFAACLPPTLAPLFLIYSLSLIYHIKIKMVVIKASSFIFIYFLKVLFIYSPGLLFQVPGPWGSAQVQLLQLSHRHLGSGLHHGRAVHPDTFVPRKQRGGRDLKNLSGAGNAEEGEEPSKCICITLLLYSCFHTCPTDLNFSTHHSTEVYLRTQTSDVVVFKRVSIQPGRSLV